MTATQPAPTLVTPTTWALDPTHSLLEFSVKHLMITTVKGHFGAATGTLTIDPTRPAQSHVDVTIDVASIDTRTEQRDQHLRSPDFFDVEKFPSITFKSTRIAGAFVSAGDAFQIVGALTIKGVTREVVLEAAFDGTIRDPWGGDRVSFTAHTKIDRRDFGLTWNQALEAGGVVVGTEVKIALEVQATKVA